MTPRPEVPREVWVVCDADDFPCHVAQHQTLAHHERQSLDLRESADGPHTVHRYVLPAPALLTADQVEALEAALLERVVDERVVYAVVGDAVPVASRKCRNLARWLLAAHARVSA